MELKNKVILTLIVCCIICFCLGFVVGVEQGLKQCISYGVKLMHGFTNITFDNNKLANLLYTYRYKIEVNGGIT